MKLLRHPGLALAAASFRMASIGAAQHRLRLITMPITATAASSGVGSSRFAAPEEEEAQGVHVSPLATSGLPYTEGLLESFGAVVECDLDQVVGNRQAFETVRSALHEYGLLVFKGQQRLHPSILAVFTHKFDEYSPSVWRDLKKNPWELEKVSPCFFPSQSPTSQQTLPTRNF